METAHDIVLESGIQRDFIDELRTIPGGDRLHDCIQCGTCSGSCPVSYFMDNPPRKLFAMIRAGLRDHVLDSASLWLCTSCYTCTLRCPKEIAVTDILYGLKRLAMREGRVRGAARAAALADSFVKVVDSRGRNFEPELLVRYYLRTNPTAMLRKGRLGLRLLRRGRMPLRGDKIKGRKQIRTLIEKSREIGGL